MADPTGTATRWATFGRTPALTLCALLALALIASVWGTIYAQHRPAINPVATATHGASEQASQNDDLFLYARITTRVANGENYYRATADELRTNDYPLKPFVAFRLPTLTILSAWLGRPAMIALQYALFGLLTWTWWVRLDGQFAKPERRLSGAMLALAGVAFALSGQYVGLHEVWAGTLVAISLALHRDERWGWSVATAALALSIRELALPYVLLMGTFALYRRNWRELAAWGLLVALFAALMDWHASEVAKVVLRGDPASPGWSSFAGWAGFVRTFHLAGPLRWLPAELAAPIILLSLFGWISWKSETGLEATLLYAGYGAAFMLVGRPNNYYWGLMVAPAFLVGLAFVPGAASDLYSAIRRHRD